MPGRRWPKEAAQVARLKYILSHGAKEGLVADPREWPDGRVGGRGLEEARAAREAKGLEPLGADAVRRQPPHTRPNRTKKSPAPLFHTASKKAYLNLREAYSRFLAAFRDAAEKLKAGDRMVAFPEGSFPPALPFVRPAFA